MRETYLAKQVESQAQEWTVLVAGARMQTQDIVALGKKSVTLPTHHYIRFNKYFGLLQKRYPNNIFFSKRQTAWYEINKFASL